MAIKALTTPLLQLPDVLTLQESLRKKNTVFDLMGCASAHLIFAVGTSFKHRLVIAPDELTAKAYYDEIKSLDENTVYFPAKDMLFFQSDIAGNALSSSRMQAVEALISKDEITVICTAAALMNKLVPREAIELGISCVTVGDRIDITEFRQNLVELGYENVGQVEHPGEFGVRGGIIDVYPLTAQNPVRIELWDDEVDNIRSFDVLSQKSVDKLKDVIIFPATEVPMKASVLDLGIKKLKSDYEKRYETLRSEMKTSEAFNLRSALEGLIDLAEQGSFSSALETYIDYFYEKPQSIIDYMPLDTVCMVVEPLKVANSGKVTQDEFVSAMEGRTTSGYVLPSLLNDFFGINDVMARLASRRTIAFSALGNRSELLEAKSHASVRVGGVNSYNGSLELLVKDLNSYRSRGYKVILMTASRTRAARLSEELLEEDIIATFTEDDNRDIENGEILIVLGEILRGIEYPDAKFVILSESDIYGQVHHKKRKVKRYEGETIASFSELTVGDFVVHENYGLGVYRGMEQMELDHIIRDYIVIEYAKGAKLYVLTSQLDCIQKYGKSDQGKAPKLNSLGAGTQEWNRTREKVQSAVGVIAQELVDLYALRQNTKGFCYGPDTVWQKEFEENFPYEETAGQLAAIEAVKKDMMSDKIMDRLICGDVGFGKTEVAIRAAFKAVQEGKQVVYLVPTTILAQQHYNNFVSRMSGYPINIGLLCRFRSAAEQKLTIKGLKEGTVDIVIGTHRLLSADVDYKDLGLLIIDEEQRFGVNHKEKIKTLKNTVDVLSLSATPIPRTLHMSLVGLREMSVLDEAPLERTPIQTFVFEYNEEMIREAITREMARGGQVYYVFNRVIGIQDMAARISELVPEASVGYIHGQMTENRVEDVMMDFINKEIDVMVATTIIEIGLDISNVNTIIIHDSDNMGLSQLYQLRGRVGRSNRTAYAFLMYKRDKMLKEVAEKRLEAIKEFTDLGSGFKIAMRDLEIRGAGNMLGKEQHGYMAAVGYDLYCKLLNEAVKEKRGMAPPSASYSTSVDVVIEAYLPKSYVPGEEQRIDLYKRMAAIESEESKDDILEELIDRFGEPKKCVMNLLWVAMLRVKAHEAGIISIEEKGDVVKFLMYNKAPIDILKIPDFIKAHSPQMSFVADPKAPYFSVNLKMNSKVKSLDKFEYISELVEEIGKLKEER